MEASTTSSGSESAPIGPAPRGGEHLLDLFFRPSTFFASRASLEAKWLIVAAMWGLGITNALERLEKTMFKEENRPQGVSNWMTLLFSNWAYYWGHVLVVGAVSGAVYWTLGGWWYRKRLEFSGVSSPDPRTARLVYAFAWFTYAGPAVALLASSTLRFASPQEDWDASELWLGFVSFGFLIWSVFTSWKAVRVAFGATSGRATFWFLGAPLTVYVVSFGVLTVAGYAMAYLRAAKDAGTEPSFDEFVEVMRLELGGRADDDRAFDPE